MVGLLLMQGRAWHLSYSLNSIKCHVHSVSSGISSLPCSVLITGRDMEGYKTFYSSRAWKDARRNYKQSVGGLCEECLKKGIITPAEIVHHKIPLTAENVGDLEISLGWCNLQALCRQCHAQAHEDMYAERTGKRYRIDENGRVVIRDSVL